MPLFLYSGDSHDTPMLDPSPVLIEFTASWCQPCKRMSDVMSQVVDNYGDQVTHTRFDTSLPSNLQFAARQGITSIPTILIFARGVEARRLTGYHDVEAVSAVLDEILTDTDVSVRGEIELEA